MSEPRSENALPIWDRVRFRCTVCNAPMGTCDCWTACACGWFYGKGSECRNPVHGEAVSTAYVADPSLPAGAGWCQAVIPPRPAIDEPGNRYCFTKAKYEREGHRVCGLHQRAKHCKWADQFGRNEPE